MELKNKTMGRNCSHLRWSLSSSQNRKASIPSRKKDELVTFSHFAACDIHTDSNYVQCSFQEFRAIGFLLNWMKAF